MYLWQIGSFLGKKKKARIFTLGYIKFIKKYCFILATNGCYLIKGWGMPPKINEHFLNWQPCPNVVRSLKICTCFVIASIFSSFEKGRNNNSRRANPP
jgi:hypothetical protein